MQRIYRQAPRDLDGRMEKNLIMTFTVRHVNGKIYPDLQSTGMTCLFQSIPEAFRNNMASFDFLTRNANLRG